MTQAVAGQDARRNLLEQKARLVESLLERAGPAAPAQARELLARAREQMAAGATGEAEASLARALQVASAAAREGGKASADQASAALRGRYEELLQGVQSFRKAFADVVSEKGSKAAAALDLKAVDRELDQAGSLADSGDYKKAVQILAGVYERTSVALTRVRANETLEYRKVFATRREEFDYEKERYKSHEMLVRVAVAEQQPAPSVLEQIQSDVHNSVALNRNAEEQAARGNYDAAIQIQEAATRHLVHALRRAGIFIPD
jgi:hypothetical protein